MRSRSTTVVAATLISLLVCLSSALAQRQRMGPEGLPRGGGPRGGRGWGFQNPYPLHAAAERGDIASMERILRRGMMMVDTPDGDGKTALHAAALAGQTNAVAWLVEHGDRIDIYAAAALGDVARMESLLQSSPELLRAHGPGGVTPLHWATKDVAKLLLDRGADVNARSALDSTPLHEASRRNLTEIVALLLDRKAEVDALNRSKATPLSLAAERGYEEIAGLLLARGAKLDIFSAAALGRLDEVERLLKSQPDLLKATDAQNNQTLLHWAAMNGRASIVRRLLNLGADVKAKDRNGFEPVHLAVRRNQKETVQLLLRSGADANARTGSGSTCLHLAVETGNADLVQLFLTQNADINAKAYNDMTPLHFAASRSNTAIVALLLDRGADVDARTMFGSTPLHSAAQDGRKATVELLLARGADANVQNERQITPFHAAIDRQRWETVKVFMEKGVGLRGYDGRTYSPLVFAIQSGAPKEFIELLLDHYRDFDERDEGGRTPLQQVAQSGRIDLLELLLSKGANVNSRNDARGRTALHWAAESGQMKMVEALLARDAAIELPDREGKTPLHLAAQRGQTDVVQLLLDKGAEVNAHASTFEPTPLSLATEAEHEEVVNLLRAHGGRASLTVARILLGWVAVCMVLGGAHYIWKTTGRKQPAESKQAG